MANDPLPGMRFDTGGSGNRDGYETWREILGEFYEVRAPDRAETTNFAASIMIWNLAGVLLTDGFHTYQRFSRSVGRARRDGFDHYTLSLNRTGVWRGDVGDSVLESGPGRIRLLDFARPVDAEVTRNDAVTLSFPRDMLDDALPARDLHVLTLDGPRGGLLAEFLLMLTRRAATLTPATRRMWRPPAGTWSPPASRPRGRRWKQPNRNSTRWLTAGRGG